MPPRRVPPRPSSSQSACRLERIPREPVLLLATYRPDFEAPWGAKSHVTPMLLGRLTRAQLGDLVRKAARGRDLPEAWVEEIVHRSDGVPLFAEELTKTVIESNPEPPADGEVPELHVPESLQDSLMARLDALGPVKELAQLGAVLGREFEYGLLVRSCTDCDAEGQATAPSGAARPCLCGAVPTATPRARPPRSSSGVVVQWRGGTPTATTRAAAARPPAAARSRVS